jgi:hypothetical protein
MNIREGTIENSIYTKLETIRTSTQKKRFSFTKSSVQVSSSTSTQCIIIAGENYVLTKYFSHYIWCGNLNNGGGVGVMGDGAV